MVVLLTGASGFIGSHLADALLAAGHEVVTVSRKPGSGGDARVRHVPGDFTKDVDPAVWQPRLAGVDVVINAVGIIREHGAQTFELIHERAPCALFAACAQAGVKMVVQVSALGADSAASSRYHLSKKRADDYLARLPVHSVIVQPSLVYGAGGASARLFTTIASLPLTGLPGGGGQRIQPVHIDDVVAATLAILDSPPPSGSRVALVGPQPMDFRSFLSALRRAMGMGTGHYFPVPMALMRMGTAVAQALPGNILDRETLDMLERGNTADASGITRLLGRSPRDVMQFIPAAERHCVRQSALRNWLLPMLRVSIAVVWIVTGIVSFGLYPVEDSHALLARVGITGWLAPLMLYGAAMMDFVFGIATLLFKRRRLLWLAQIAVILFYTAIISWRLPEFWLHPYGPLLKNLPMLAAIWLLLEMEER